MAAGLSFMVIGFAPFSRARKGIVLSVFMVSVISIPLYLSFVNMQEIAVVKKQLLGQSYQIGGQQQLLRNIKVRLGDSLKISGDLIGTKLPDAAILSQFEQHFSEQFGKAVIVDFSVRLVAESYFINIEKKGL